jgi:hypothetical protein
MAGRDAIQTEMPAAGAKTPEGSLYDLREFS